MRISDWSSDVCSSDLHRHASGTRDLRPARQWPLRAKRRPSGSLHLLQEAGRTGSCRRDRRGGFCSARHPDRPSSRPKMRSEEHTSELQSLMRISYAVFCLKKKITTINTHTNNNSQTDTTQTE